jgi:hypothetical protein
MKKGLLIALLFIALNSLAENNVSLNLVNFAIKKPSVAYERTFFNELIGLRCELGVFIPSDYGIIDRAMPSDLSVDKSTKNIDFENNFTGFTAIPEVRFYPTMGKFYIGAYYKYAQRKTNFEKSFLDNSRHDDNLILNFNSSSGGIVLGTKWTIARLITLDWYWMGLGVAHNTLKLRLEAEDRDFDYDIIEIQNKLDKIGRGKGGVETESGDGYAEGRMKFFFPAYRFGLSVGIKF